MSVVSWQELRAQLAACGRVCGGLGCRSPGLGEYEGTWGRDIFRPLHGSVLSMSRSAATAASRLVPLVGESPVSGQKPQPLSHMF